MKKKIIIVIVFILVLITYLYYENNFLGVTYYNIKTDKIKDKIKIAHISDFHNTKSKKLTNDLINKIKKESIDLIVITGDLIDSRKTDINISINLIKKLNKISKVYYVPGNHESRITEYESFINKLKENNVIVLNNQKEELNNEITLIGVDDPTLFKENYIDDNILIDKTLKDLELNTEKYNILLSHRPELFNTYKDNNIDLALTGHAHGGQIRLPFIGGLIAPNQGLFPKYTSGMHKENETTMIVSRGIGNSLFPFRINNKPELVIINIDKKI